MTCTPAHTAAPAPRACLRVLHMIDAAAAWGGACTQRLLADAIPRLRGGERIEHETLILGTLDDARRSMHCGLQPVGAIHALSGATMRVRKPLERFLAARIDADVRPHVIHAWTGSAGTVACALSPRFPVVVTPRPLAIDLDSPHLLPRDVIRDRWRRELGIGSDEFVLGLLGEPIERFDARQTMHVGTRAGLSSRRIRMVMSGRIFGRAESQRCLEQLALDHTSVQDDALLRPWEVLRGLDAALLLEPMAKGPQAACDASALPLLWALAAGVPVIVEDSAPGSDLIAHERNGLMFPQGNLNDACERLTRLYDDRALVARLTAAGRQMVAERHLLGAFCGEVEAAYERAMQRGRAEYLDWPPTR